MKSSQIIASLMILAPFWGATSAQVQTSIPETVMETCGPTDLLIHFSPAPFDQTSVSITATSNTGEGARSVLTFEARSFGYECRKNALGWGGYVVFQTACPVKTGIHDEYEPCDFKNNFGVIYGSTVLAVPSSANAQMAAKVFHYPSQKKIPPLSPVPLLFRAKEF